MFSIETFNYCRSPPSVGKTSLTKQIIKHFVIKLNSLFKIDVIKAFEDIELRKEFNILTKKKYIQGTSAQTMLVSW